MRIDYRKVKENGINMVIVKRITSSDGTNVNALGYGDTTTCMKQGAKYTEKEFNNFMKIIKEHKHCEKEWIGDESICF